DSRQNSIRTRRTTGYGDVDRNDVRDRAGARVAAAENAARCAAVADRDDELRVGCGVVGALERDLHVPRDGPRHEQQIRVPGARDESDSQPLDVVERVVESVDLELATVTRAGIDLTNAQRPAQRREDLRLQMLAHPQLIRGERRRFGDDTDG